MVLLALAGLALIAIPFGSARRLTMVSGEVIDQGQASRSEPIVVDSRGRPVYVLTGDSVANPECTRSNGCFNAWIPAKLNSSTSDLTVAHGIEGRLSLWHRDGLYQLVLAGHPLYTSVADLHGMVVKHHATGEGIKSFGGTWHVVTPGAHSPPSGRQGLLP